MSDKLISWLSKELIERGWSHRELARRIGISQTTVSEVLAAKRKPGWDFCAAVAKELGETPETVMRIAGLLPPLQNKGNSGDVIQKLNEIVSLLPDLYQQDVLEYAHWRYLRFRDEDVTESIQILGDEIERLFSLLNPNERAEVLSRAARDRRFRDMAQEIVRRKSL